MVCAGRATAGEDPDDNLVELSRRDIFGQMPRTFQRDYPMR